MVSVLAIRPKVRGFKPGRGHGFLRAIKIRSMSSFGGEVNPSAPCRKNLRHVKEPYEYERQNYADKTHHLLSPHRLILISYYMALQVGLPESALVDESGILPYRHYPTMVLYAHTSRG
jgi:hypothetical protein